MIDLATKYINLHGGSLNSIFIDSTGFPIEHCFVCNYYFITDEK